MTICRISAICLLITDIHLGLSSEHGHDLSKKQNVYEPYQKLCSPYQQWSTNKELCMCSADGLKLHCIPKESDVQIRKKRNIPNNDPNGKKPDNRYEHQNDNVYPDQYNQHPHDPNNYGGQNQGQGVAHNQGAPNHQGTPNHQGAPNYHGVPNGAQNNYGSQYHNGAPNNNNAAQNGAPNSNSPPNSNGVPYNNGAPNNNGQYNHRPPNNNGYGNKNHHNFDYYDTHNHPRYHNHPNNPTHNGVPNNNGAWQQPNNQGPNHNGAWRNQGVPNNNGPYNNGAWNNHGVPNNNGAPNHNGDFNYRGTPNNNGQNGNGAWNHQGGQNNNGAWQNQGQQNHNGNGHDYNNYNHHGHNQFGTPKHGHDEHKHEHDKSKDDDHKHDENSDYNDDYEDEDDLNSFDYNHEETTVASSNTKEDVTETEKEVKHQGGSCSTKGKNQDAKCNQGNQNANNQGCCCVPSTLLNAKLCQCVRILCSCFNQNCNSPPVNNPRKGLRSNTCCDNCCEGLCGSTPDWKCFCTHSHDKAHGTANHIKGTTTERTMDYDEFWHMCNNQAMTDNGDRISLNKVMDICKREIVHGSRSKNETEERFDALKSITDYMRACFTMDKPKRTPPPTIITTFNPKVNNKKKAKGLSHIFNYMKSFVKKSLGASDHSTTIPPNSEDEDFKKHITKRDLDARMSHKERSNLYNPNNKAYRGNKVRQGLYQGQTVVQHVDAESSGVGKIVDLKSGELTYVNV